MAKIAVDVDSTLYDFDGPAREACFQLFRETGDEDYKQAAYHTGGEWRSYTDILGLQKWLGAIDLVHESQSILKQLPFDGAVETLNALRDEGHCIMFITNRKAHSREATHEWLFEETELGSVLDDTLVVTEDDKKPFMAECQYLIDDRVKTVVQFVHDYDWTNKIGSASEERARHAFVKAYPYNINLTDVPRVWLSPSWAGINIHMEKVGLLPEVAYEAAV